MITKRFLKTKNEVDIVFDLTDPTGSETISVVTDANGWDPVPMRKTADGWQLKLRLATGTTYQFRYLTSDGAWMNDAAADGSVDNGHGSQNSVVDTTRP